MQKRVIFRHKWLPYALIAPQILITIVFFFWPAIWALETSFYLEDAFGLSREFVGLQNFRELFANEAYLRSFWTTMIFGISVTALSMFDGAGAGRRREPGDPLCDHVPDAADLALRRGARASSACCGMFMLNPFASASWRYCVATSSGYGLEPLRLDGNQAMMLVHGGCRVEADLVTTSCSSWQACNRSRVQPHRSRRDRPAQARQSRFWTITFPLLSPTTFFLLVVNLVYAFFDTFSLDPRDHVRRPRRRDVDPGLQGLQHRLRRAGLRWLGGTVGRADGAGDRHDGRPVPIRRAKGSVLMSWPGRTSPDGPALEGQRSPTRERGLPW